MQEESEPAIRRILVALDASPSSLAALEATAELAASLGAELAGLFVEDIELLQIAELPFAKTVDSFSAGPQELDTQMLERGLRASATRARRALELAAQRQGRRVRWSFRVARGTVPAEVLAAASGADLIGLGTVGWSPLPAPRMGTTARTVILEAPSSVLLLPAGTRLAAPIMVLYDGSPEAHKALSTVLHLATGGRLLVFLQAHDAESTKQLREQAEGLLRQRGPGAAFRTLGEADGPTLVREVEKERGGVLVLPIRSLRQEGGSLLEVLEGLRPPILLVR